MTSPSSIAPSLTAPTASAPSPTTITVLIPTYRRPQDLLRCLAALSHQHRLADEVLVVVRESDRQTWQSLDAFQNSGDGNLPLTLQPVTVPGQVAALNTGLDVAKGDIIAITDDDAAPHPDWLERIEAHFQSNPNIGGVGGRDWVYEGDTLQSSASPGPSSAKTSSRAYSTSSDATSKIVVGQVQWFGRVIGNHHIGSGDAQEVAILKGVNMSYRRTAIGSQRFAENLRGNGAQVHNDRDFSLRLKKHGWTLIYDPNVAVKHYPAQRFDPDSRHQFNSEATMNAVHNETLTMLNYLPHVQRFCFMLWAIFVGTRDSFGLIQFLRFLPTDKLRSWQKLLAALEGRWLGWQTWLSSSPSTSRVSS